MLPAISVQYMRSNILKLNYTLVNNKKKTMPVEIGMVSNPKLIT